MRDITHIVIHCAATPNGDPRFDIEDIRRWHIEERHWADVGYHYVITVRGEVQKGRPEEHTGAHAAGYNTKSIGVCLVGTDEFTIYQWEALAKLIADLKSRYPQAKVVGHGDLPNVNKICPGFSVHLWQSNNMLAMTEKMCGIERTA